MNIMEFGKLYNEYYLLSKMFANFNTRAYFVTIISRLVTCPTLNLKPTHVKIGHGAVCQLLNYENVYRETNYIQSLQSLTVL